MLKYMYTVEVDMGCDGRYYEKHHTANEAISDLWSQVTLCPWAAGIAKDPLGRIIYTKTTWDKKEYGEPIYRGDAIEDEKFVF